jgi:hydroxyacylglutathione hydrolase
MLFQQIYDPDLAQGSYFVGCQATGEAIVIDPRRDIAVYLDEARAQGMTIVAVTETHIHADYLSGARDLAAATGATLWLSDEGGPDWQYAFEHRGLRHGDAIEVGNLRLEAIHTPGHTLEHVAFLLTDGAAASEPGFYLTGDFVFVGDVGRPDLVDEAAGGRDTRFPMASDLFRSLRDRFLNLPDYVQVWPGHGAGSACGKALGAVPSSTVGYERRFAWWAGYLADDDEEGFVAALLDGQPDAPAYFGRMKRWNREGPALLGERDPLPEFGPNDLGEALERGALLIDTRASANFAAGYLPGSINLPDETRFTGWAAWAIDPEAAERDLLLLAADRAHAETLRDRLSRTGIDRVVGYTTGLGDLPRRSVEQVAPRDLDGLDDPYLLDIRAGDEFAAGHVPGAHRIHGGRVLWHLDALPRDRTIVTYCRSGARAAPVASALRVAGFEDVRELEGSYQGWQRAARAVAT